MAKNTRKWINPILKLLPDNHIDRIALLFTFFVFILYVSTMSMSLDDEDCAHFALGLNDYDLQKHQPHVPGFPVYMAMGMAVNFFIQNPLLSLTFLSALFGALGVLVFYWLAKHATGRTTGLAAAMVLAFTPLYWLNSLKAMTDMFGLFFVLLALFFLYRYMEGSNGRDLLIGALIGGLSTGVRIHSFFILLPVLLFVLATVGKDKSEKNGFKSIMIFFLGIALWLLPVMMVTGAPEYMDCAQKQFNYRIGREDLSILGVDNGMGFHGERFGEYTTNFVYAGYGINLWDNDMVGYLLVLFIVGFIYFSLCKIKGIRDKRTLLFLLLSVIIYLPVIYILLPAFNPRYLLILTPLLSLLFAKTVVESKSLDNVKKSVIIIVFIGLLSANSIPAAIELHTTPSAPVQLAEFIQYNHTGSVVASNMWLFKFFDYYGVDAKRLVSFNCNKIVDALSENQTVFGMVTPENCNNVVIGKTHLFFRNQMLHMKRHSLVLHEYKLARLAEKP